MYLLHTNVNEDVSKLGQIVNCRIEAGVSSGRLAETRILAGNKDPDELARCPPLYDAPTRDHYN